jgi:hypothetical protein
MTPPCRESTIKEVGDLIKRVLCGQDIFSDALGISGDLSGQGLSLFDNGIIQTLVFGYCLLTR